jgi:ABC-type Mn2+/Zn2+ transport system ATPase subunit
LAAARGCVSGNQQGGYVNVDVRYCNSIDTATISIEPGRLNIKYGPNGTGKSTIAKAIELAVRGGDLAHLMPFKHRGKDAATTPRSEVRGLQGIASVFVFNEEYVNQFVFQQDEVVKNSFDIFIKSADYDTKMAAIEVSVAGIKDTFTKNEDLDQVLKDLAELSDSFGKSQSGISKAGKLIKALGGGNKLENVPEILTPYIEFIKSDASVKWIGWQLKGKEFLDIGSKCPYCAFSVEGKKETILSVGNEYDAKSIEHLIGLQAVFSRLGNYFSPQCAETVAKILKNKTGLSKEEINYLVELKGQVETLRGKLADLQTISFFSLRDIAVLEDRIGGLKIDLQLLTHLASGDTTAIVEQINRSLDTVLQSAGKLKGEINIQKKGIQDAITKHKAQINTFLRYAGYKYEVDIQPDGQAYKMKLMHVDFPSFIDNGSEHLSFGERNAFSIVLFMYECLTKNPSLVILDDPISSFDKSKKFAMMQILFRGNESLRGKTVLMLTHDLEPIIDMVKSLSHTFAPMPVAGFLTAKKGTVTETEIKKSDLLTFAQICRGNIETVPNDVIKLIYLRRHYEIVDDKGLAYQMLSSLLHKRQAPSVRNPADQSVRNMTALESANAAAEIQKELPSFDYAALYAIVVDEALMKAAYVAALNGYERLQLFRIICNDNHDNDVVKKYINEAFHIENEQIVQLNPHAFDWIPDYIVAECDQALGVS